jgi:hypothetical protein
MSDIIYLKACCTNEIEIYHKLPTTSVDYETRNQGPKTHFLRLINKISWGQTLRHKELDNCQDT